MGGTGPAFANSWIPLFYAPETLVRLYSSIYACRRKDRVSTCQVQSIMSWFLLAAEYGNRQRRAKLHLLPHVRANRRTGRGAL